MPTVTARPVLWLCAVASCCPETVCGLLPQVIFTVVQYFAATWRHPIEAPVYPTLTGPFYVRVWCWFVIISFICWCILMFIISLLSNIWPRTIKEIPARRENYPVPDPTRFLDPGPDRPPRSIAKYSPVTRIFLGLHGPVRISPTVRVAPLVFSALWHPAETVCGLLPQVIFAVVQYFAATWYSEVFFFFFLSALSLFPQSHNSQNYNADMPGMPGFMLIDH